PSQKYLLFLILLILARQGLGQSPVFRAEFVLEDSIMLLCLAFTVVPSKFRPLIWLVIVCLMGTTLALISWMSRVHEPQSLRAIVFTAIFGLLVIQHSVLAVSEALKLRKSRFTDR